jgi:hypothetical protein
MENVLLAATSTLIVLFARPKTSVCSVIARNMPLNKENANLALLSWTTVPNAFRLINAFSANQRLSSCLKTKSATPAHRSTLNVPLATTKLNVRPASLIISSKTESAHRVKSCLAVLTVTRRDAQLAKPGSSFRMESVRNADPVSTHVPNVMLTDVKCVIRAFTSMETGNAQIVEPFLRVVLNVMQTHALAARNNISNKMINASSAVRL